MHRVFSQRLRVAGSALMIVLLAASTAGAAEFVEDPTMAEPPPDDFVGDELPPGELFQGGPGFNDFVGYPDAYDPENPAIVYDQFLEVSYDPETGLVYDPYGGIVFDVQTGEATFHESGDPAPRVPLDILRDMIQPTLGVTADASINPNIGSGPGFGPDAPTVAADGNPVPDGNPVTDPAPSDPAIDSSQPERPSDFANEDPVLALYETGFTTDDLAAYAFDTSQLPDGAVDDAFQFTAYEIALLFEMGAFTRGTPWYDTFADIHAQFDLGDTQDQNLVQTFGAVDQEFARRTNLFQAALDPQDDYFASWPVSPLGRGFYEDMANGAWSFMVGYEYAAGLLRIMASGADTDLISTGGAEIVELEAALAGAIEALEIQEDLNALLRADIDDLRAQVAALSNPAIDVLLPTLDGVDAGGDQGDLVLYGAIAAGAVLLLLGSLFFLVRSRRRGGPDRVQVASDEAMATTQLLAGAKDETDIIRILDRAAERHVGAPLTLFHVVDDGLREAGNGPIVTDTDLARIVHTGQRATTVLHDDPAFPAGSRAVMALPVIAGGSVRAVLTAHRHGDQPFGDADLAKLEGIAPALGGTLERTAELGTMSKLAMVDGLTSLGNRRRLDGDLETTIASAVAGDAPLGFAMIDVDHFKTYNDTHGHSAGDEVLRRVASTIAECVRDSDVVYRYGGEEFSMLLPGATPEEAATVAERVRAAVEAAVFPGEERQPGGSLTISVGVATLATGSGDDIRERADQALYAAKSNGRNRVAFG